MQAFLFLIAFLVSQVAPYKFHLTYRKLKGNHNDLILYCSSNSSLLQNFSFWINETEQIDILNGIPPEDIAVRMTEGAVFFHLQPQYEGTFYCGEIDGEKSNGVGPIAGIIKTLAVVLKNVLL